jgi:ATP-dependent protease HslVU (ClpYQ) peptidase subunit
MTVIVGVIEGGKAWIGGDSALSDMETHELIACVNQKVFRVGEFVIGCAGSARVGDALRYSFDPPKHPRRMDVGRYMRTAFINGVRDTLRAAGTLQQFQGIDGADSTILVGYRGRLFIIEGDLHVHEAIDDYAAVGSGGAVANGALSVSQGVPPRKRILAAMSASERYTASVRRPFYVLGDDAPRHR